jgi:hypothetical protein
MLSSQPDSRRILTYGLDETLLQTRRLLLEQAGYTVDAASTPESFQSYMAGAKTAYSLLILCHTIAIPEQEEISLRLSPQTAVYRLKEPVSPSAFLKQVSDLVSTI